MPKPSTGKLAQELMRVLKLKEAKGERTTDAENAKLKEILIVLTLLLEERRLREKLDQPSPPSNPQPSV